MRNIFKISTKTRMRYPRTKVHKRAGTLVRPPNRPAKFKLWRFQPLTVTTGHFRRLRRELFTKPVRAEYIRAQLTAGDAVLAKELGLA